MATFQVGYSGTKVNALYSSEAKNVTIALGAAYIGNEYFNADTLGTSLYVGGVGHYDFVTKRDPEKCKEIVDDQITTLKEVISPYVGRWVAARHFLMGVEQEEWQLWQLDGSNRKAMHCSGIILGIEGIVFEKRYSFNPLYKQKPTTLDQQMQIRDTERLFKIGLVLDTTEMCPAFSYDVQAPEANRMLVPILGFPHSEESFHGVWSWQLVGEYKL